MLVSMIMMNMMDSMYAQPSPRSSCGHYDAGNFGHNFLASMNIFSIWQVAVTGIGLAVVSGRKSPWDHALLRALADLRGLRLVPRLGAR